MNTTNTTNTIDPGFEQLLKQQVLEIEIVSNSFDYSVFAGAKGPLSGPDSVNDEPCAQPGISRADYESAMAAEHALTIAREQELQAKAQAFLSANQGDKTYVYGHIENFKRLLKAAHEAKLGEVKRVITRALFLYEGWEMDNYAALVELTDGRVVGITTSHGRAYVMERAEAEKQLRDTELSAASIHTMLTNWPTE